MDSLKHYITFMKREFFEEETGEVFGNVGKDRGQIRLYNAPWLHHTVYGAVFTD